MWIRANMEGDRTMDVDHISPADLHRDMEHIASQTAGDFNNMEDTFEALEKVLLVYRYHRKGRIHAALAGGQMLNLLRPQIESRKWTAFIEGTGLNVRTAYNWIALAKAGLTVADVLDYGGIKKALKALNEDISEPFPKSEPPEPEPELIEGCDKLPEPEPDDWPALGEPDESVRSSRTDSGLEQSLSENGNVIKTADEPEEPEPENNCKKSLQLPDEPPDKPPTRLELAEAQLAAEKARNDDLQGRVAFDDADGYIAAQEQEVRVGRTRIGDLITESDTRRRAAEYWERQCREARQEVADVKALLSEATNAMTLCVDCSELVSDDVARRCKGCAGHILATLV